MKVDISFYKMLGQLTMEHEKKVDRILRAEFYSYLMYIKREEKAFDYERFEFLSFKKFLKKSIGSDWLNKMIDTVGEKNELKRKTLSKLIIRKIDFIYKIFLTQQQVLCHYS